VTKFESKKENNPKTNFMTCPDFPEHSEKRTNA